MLLDVAYLAVLRARSTIPTLYSSADPNLPPRAPILQRIRIPHSAATDDDYVPLPFCDSGKFLVS